jgi:hypothetical protein
MARTGRPPSDKYKIDNMVKIIRTYTDSAELPLMQEVCTINNWSRSRVHQLSQTNKELLDAIKRMYDKDEITLIRKGLEGKYAPAMAIFLLKQPIHGFTDKQVVENNQSIQMLDELIKGIDKEADSNEIIV